MESAGSIGESRHGIFERAYHDLGQTNEENAFVWGSVSRCDSHDGAQQYDAVWNVIDRDILTGEGQWYMEKEAINKLYMVSRHLC